MSIARIAARLALVEALKGATLVGDNVHDSLIGGIEADENGQLNIGVGENRPFISVYSDAAKTNDADLRSLKENGLTEIVLEWGIAAGMSVEDATGEPLIDEATGQSHVAVGIPDTDSAMEFALDMIGRQIGDTLTDPDNVWAEIFRDIASGGISAVERQRIASGTDGQRRAAHQMRITCALMDDPVKGAELPEPFPRLFEMMTEIGGESLARRDMIEKQIAGVANELSLFRRHMGFTAAEALSLGVAPLETDDGSIGELGEGTVSVDNHGDHVVEASE
ncbi:hypothetical protein [Oricola indica]|jgi:hypothetical protein|uniref:hypothetical protein n=1 Tax=Oricola indica TaxID=2872591 RepID=UPI001CBACAD8|nr:hypothetical protein [Oricola indica]